MEASSITSESREATKVAVFERRDVVSDESRRQQQTDQGRAAVWVAGGMADWRLPAWRGDWRGAFEVFGEEVAQVADGALPTKEQHESYDKEGYLHVPGFFNAEELAQLRQHVKDLEDAPDEVGGCMKYWEAHAESGDRILCRVEDFCRRHKEFQNLFDQADAKMLQFSKALLGGDDLCLFKDKINCKLPGGDGFKVTYTSISIYLS